jgi:large subunit ribosomal protein L9
MKVLLSKDVENLGYAGEVYEVADGYARNYLLPRGLAERATPGVLKAAQAWRSRAEAHRAQIRAEYELLSERIEATSLTFEAKAGDTGKLYGSITTADIAEKLSEKLGIEVDRRKVEGSGLRQLGTHKVKIKLDITFHPQVTVEIVDESADDELEMVAEAPVADAAEEMVVDEA